MSMHKKPLTELEHAGLKAHGLDIGTPSQLSDVFRQGIAFALANSPQPREWVGLSESAIVGLATNRFDSKRSFILATEAKLKELNEE